MRELILVSLVSSRWAVVKPRCRISSSAACVLYWSFCTFSKIISAGRFRVLPGTGTCYWYHTRVYQHSPTESLQNDALNLTTGTPVLRKGKTIDTSNSLCMEEHGRTVCVVEILLTSILARYVFGSRTLQLSNLYIPVPVPFFHSLLGYFSYLYVLFTYR